MREVGLTSTIPVEVLYAAGCRPVDLNNVFIAAPDPGVLVEEAERAGYPRNTCAWIKGIYAAVLGRPAMREIIAVTEGDCSNTHALMETLQVAGRTVIPFAFPYGRDADLLRLSLQKLMDYFGVTWEETERARERLLPARELAWEVDRRTWEEDTVSGLENHLALVSCSDFGGDPEAFAASLQDLLAERRVRRPPEIRLGYIGVPPIFPDLYGCLEEMGARVVFNEVQRQFAMPFPGAGLLEQYRRYTYPYDVFARLEDIRAEIRRRRIAGVIHYTQSFCHRQIQDLIFRQSLPVPVLTLEGDRPGRVDARTRIRLEAFLEILR